MPLEHTYGCFKESVRWCKPFNGSGRLGKIGSYYFGTYMAFDISGSNEDVWTLWPSVGAMPAASAMSSDLHMQG